MVSEPVPAYPGNRMLVEVLESDPTFNPFRNARILLNRAEPGRKEHLTRRERMLEQVDFMVAKYHRSFFRPMSILRRKSRPVDLEALKYNNAYRQFVFALVQNLRAVMKDEYGTKADADKLRGIGIQASQIGVHLRVVLMGMKETKPTRLDPGREEMKETVMINPRILSESAETASFMEGCLSVPALKMPNAKDILQLVAVERPLEIRVEYWDLNGVRHEVALKAWQARTYKHEDDHMEGILIVDYAEQPLDPDTYDTLVQDDMDALLLRLHKAEGGDDSVLVDANMLGILRQAYAAEEKEPIQLPKGTYVAMYLKNPTGM